MINTKRDRYNLYGRLIPKQGDPIDQSGVTWIYFNQPKADSMRCDIYYRVLFPLFGYISSRCRVCFKIGIKPTNIVDLIIYKSQSIPMLLHKVGIRIDIAYIVIRIATKRLLTM